jgi:hypothetical protein
VWCLSIFIPPSLSLPSLRHGLDGEVTADKLLERGCSPSVLPPDNDDQGSRSDKLHSTGIRLQDPISESVGISSQEDGLG